MRVALVTSGVALALIAGCGNQIGQPFSSNPSFGGGVGTGGVTTTGGGFIGGTYQEPVVTPKSRLPPISGGTLLVISQGHKAAVADPERDHVTIVDIDQLAVTTTISFAEREEPGRLVEDASGLVHVVLRGAGAVATLDPVAGTEVARQSVCGNPRGLAYDAKADNIHVACAGGELVTLKAAGGALVRKVALERDLRDVVVDGDRLLVSRFRAAELLVVESDGHVSAKLTPPSIPSAPTPENAPPGSGNPGFSPAVAWRTIQAPGGGAIMSFQEEQTGEVEIQPGGYGGPCGGIVRSAVSLLRADGSGWTTLNTSLVLPLDLAVTRDGSQVTVVGAGAAPNPMFSGSVSVATFVSPPPGTGIDPGFGRCGTFPDGFQPSSPGGQVVSVAIDPSLRTLVQTRDPMLIVGNRAIVLPGSLIRDTGQELFHMGTSGGIACASCHPEGRDDGHVWTFAGLGTRRTQSLAGGTLGNGPFHWTGDMRDFLMLSQEVFQNRMNGPALRTDHVQALSGWIDQVPAYKPVAAADPASADRGRALFNDTAVACATCHTGTAMTTHAIVDVGTGAPFKVPSLLGVGFRAPYMHDGCAATLADRFGSCGGTADKHGRVASLTDAQRSDLVAYLETL